MHLSVCYYHITHAFQSESTLHMGLNIKKLLTRNRHDVWNLSDCSRTRTHNHLVCRWTLNHLAELAKRLSCLVGTYLWDIDSLPYVGIFGLKCYKINCRISNQVPRVCGAIKFHLKQKKTLNLGPKIVYLGNFRPQFERTLVIIEIKTFEFVRTQSFI